MADQGVWAAARAVRCFLPELVGPAAGEVDAEIARLLAEDPQGGNIQERLREVLECREETSAFLEAVLDDAPYFRPPQVRPGALKGPGFSGLPGETGVGAPQYRCPVGDDYDWWQLRREDQVTVCQTHGCALVRA